MDVAAFCISLFALIVSVFDVYYNAYYNKVNLKSTYFQHLYDDYLYQTIPKARDCLRVNNKGRLEGYTQLTDAVINLVSDLKFFK